MELTTELLEKKFNEYNTLYFNDSLPTPSFRIINSYRNCGKFRFIEIPSRKKINHERIEISGYYDWTEEQLRDVIIHEMIHFYVIRNHMEDEKDSHGGEFMKIANELNEKYGMNISKKTDITTLKRKKGSPILSWIWANTFYY